MNNNLITILGPTASGKTRIAAGLAYHIKGEIISADSRQVYIEMNIGTGKDYEDYIIHRKKIPSHLIDIVEPGTEFNVFQYQQEFLAAFKKIISRNAIPILCGGSGLYLESVLKGYKLIDVPLNQSLRKSLGGKSIEELTEVLSAMRKLHNITDTLNIDRTIRAIEIETYYKENPHLINDFPSINPIIIGIHTERNILREKITQRLKKRLQTGMIEEVKRLLEKEIPPEKLKFYGLEYKFITQYLLGELTYDNMFALLNTAIHQFAKRQMTWFRRMEKHGFKIHWMDGTLPTDIIIEKILGLLKGMVEMRHASSLL